MSGGRWGWGDEVSAKSLGAEKGKCEITPKEKLHHLSCFLRIISFVASAPTFFCTRFSLEPTALGGGRAGAMTVNDVHFHAGSETRLMGLQ